MRAGAVLAGWQEHRPGADVTEPAAQPPPARPLRRPQLTGGTCRNCGRTNQSLPAFGLCWACYARPRRRRAGVPPLRIEPGDPRTQTLDALAAAHGRIPAAEAEADRTLATLRGYVAGAYRDGLSYAQVSELVGRAPMTVQSWVPPKYRRSMAQPIWGGERASAQVVDRWRPILTAAAQATDVAQDRLREVRAQFREQVAAATDDTNPARIGVRRIAGRLGVPLSTAQGWLTPRRKGERRGRFRCTAIKPDGARCGNTPRVGKRTCWNHRAQEPTT